MIFLMNEWYGTVRYAQVRRAQWLMMVYV